MFANGYKYWLAYRKGPSGYYRCARYKLNCPGRCTVSDDGVVQNSSPHDHPPEADRLAVDRFRKVLSRRAATERTDLHEIYLEEATSRHAEASMLYTFSQAESCMRKARRKLLPMEPSGMDELGNLLEGSDLFRIHCGSNRDGFYQTTVSSDADRALILWHKRTLDAIGRIDTLFVDCSSEVCTRGSTKYHVLLGMAIFCNRGVPVIYSIMTDKTYAILARIFSYIREQLHMAPDLIISESDGMIYSALEMSFPKTTVKVYWYHYMAAILDRYHEYNLGVQTPCGYANSALRMLLVLPLLPAEYMGNGLDLLVNWMDKKNIFSVNLRNLCDYVNTFWLAVVGAKRLSLFNHTRGTSCVANNFLHKFRLENNVKQQSIWQMLETLTRLATKQYVIINKNLRKMTGSSCKTKSKTQVVQEETIKKAKDLWLQMPEDLKDPFQFLQACSHCIDKDMLTKRPSMLGSEKAVHRPLVNGFDCPLEIPMVAQNNPNNTLILQNPNVPRHSENIPSVEIEPPPLAFFPKLRQVEPKKVTNICQTEPPPLVPFVTVNYERPSVPLSTIE